MGKPNIIKMRAKRDIEGLIKALKHKDVVVRLGAAMALGEIGDARAVEPLIKAMQDGYYYVELAAEMALKKIMRKIK